MEYSLNALRNHLLPRGIRALPLTEALDRVRKLPLLVCLLFIFLFLVGVVAGASASTPESARVVVAVSDWQGQALANGALLRVYDAEGIKICEEPANNKTVTLDLPKGFYSLKSFRTYAWLGEYQTGNASLTVNDLTKSYPVALKEDKLYSLQLKVEDLNETFSSGNETLAKWLDNSTVRVELCAENINRTSQKLYWHTVGIAKSLPYQYIYQQDGLVRQTFFCDYGGKAQDHAPSYERYPDTSFQRLYTKEGFFYADALPSGAYYLKVWDGVHLLAKMKITLGADATYKLQIPYDEQEQFNYAYSQIPTSVWQAVSEQQTYNLGVTVVDSHGNLMPDKKVQIFDENSNLVRSQFANENAYTKFYALPQARYQIHVPNEPNATWIYLNKDMEIKVDPITGSTVWSEFPYLSSVLSQNATHYIYRTNWGNYTFLKSAPYVSSFISRYGDACINSTFWVKPQNTILVFPFNTQVLIANNTYYKIRYEVRYVATVVAYMNQSWDFNRIDKPKITVTLQKTAQWTQGNFEVFWISSASYVKTSETTAVQCTSGAYSWLANTTMAEIGVSSTPQTWRSWIVSDWGDVGVSRLGTGTISVSGTGGWSIRGTIVYFNVNLGQIDPSTVGTSTDSYATRCPLQRKSFYANGRYWVFYSDATNMVYSTSTDGSTWSSATSVRTCATGSYFSIWFDGKYFHYAYSSEQANNALFYRRGTPNSAGTVTWSANEQTVVSAITGITYICANIAVDSGGYPWIGYRRYDGTNNYPYITKASTIDGTWATASGFPYALSAASYPDWCITAVPLTAEKVYVLYAASGITVRGKLWTGSWGSEVVASQGNIQSGIFYSAVAEGDNVHLVYLKQASYDINYRKFTYGTGWGTEVTVQPSATSTSAPVLSIDTATNNLYCFWAGKPTANRIYYSIRYASNSSWGSPNDWISDSPLTDYDRLTCFYKTYGYQIGLVYMYRKNSPYQVRFAYLTMPTVSITVTSSPVGCNIRVDSGAWQTSPQTYSWNPGDSHSIEAQNPYVVTTNQEQYIWASWSDSGANPHSITVPSSATTYTATMTHQWYFLASSTYDTPTGTGWYNAGSSCSGSTVTTPVSGGSGVRYQTSGWTGTGSLSSGGTYGSTTTGSFTINAYSTCTWNWITQYQPTITLTGTTSSLTTSITARTLNGASNTPSGLYSSWSDWCDSGTTLTFSDVNTGGGSSTEKLHTVSTRSWTVSSAFSATITYIHQWKPTITLTGTTSSLTVSITARTLDGSSNTPSGLYTSWSDWCDDSTTLTFSTLNTGGGSSTERLHTVDTVSWSVTSALAKTIVYIHQWKPTITLTGTTSSLTVSITDRTLDGSAATASGLYASWSDWCDDSTTLTFSTSNTGGGSSTERLHTVSTVSWSVTSALSSTITYIHQWKPSITLGGTSSGDTVSITARTLDGSSNTPSGLSSSWSDWCDDSTTLTFSATSTSGKQCRSTTARSWTVTSAFSATVIWDRIRIDSIGVVNGRIDVNTQGTFYVTASLEYDNHPLGSGDTLTLSGYVFTWNAGNNRFETSDTKSSVQAVTIDTFTSGNEATYGITVGNINSQTGTIVWDRFEFVSITADDTRINVGGTFELRYQIRYDFDDVTFDNTKGSISGFSWDAVNSWWDKSVTGSSSVTSTNYDETYISITDTTYGLTAKQDVSGVNVITDRIRILSLGLIDSRINADGSSTSTLYATAELEYDNHALGSGDSLTISGIALSWNAGNSRFEGISGSSSSVTAITYNSFTSGNEATYGITVGSMNGQSTTLIFDKVKVVSYSIADSRVNINDNVNIDATLQYQYDNTPVTDGTVTINGISASHQGSGVWRITRTSASVTSVTYDTVACSGNTYGITTVNQNSQSTTVIWDRIRIDTLGLTDTRINADGSSTSTLYATASLEYDDHALGSGDSITISGIVLNWVAGNSRFEGTTDSSSSVTAITYDTYTSGDEATYGITTGNINGESATLVFDKARVYYEVLDDSRVNINDNIEFRVKGILLYDNHSLGSGDTVTANFGALTWDSGNSWFKGTRTQGTVGDYMYLVSSLSEATYGITAFEINVTNPTGIWDRIMVYYEQLDGSRVNINDNIEYRVKAVLAYDQHPLGSGDSITANAGVMTWDAGNSWFDKTRTQATVGSYVFQVTSGSEATYGITSIATNQTQPTGVWDRIRITGMGNDNSRRDISTTGTFWATANLEYNSHTLGSGDSLTIQGIAMSWNAGNSRFEATDSQSSVTSVTYNTFTSGNEVTYGITAGTMNGYSTTIIWDQIIVYYEQLDDSRVNINSPIEYRVKAVLAYDQHALGSSDSLTANAGSMSWDSGNSWFKVQKSQATVSDYQFQVAAGSEATYGITALTTNQTHPTGVWDRIRITGMGNDDNRRDVGTTGTFWATAVLEYDNHALGSGDSLTISGKAMSWNAGNNRFEATDSRSSVQAVTYDTFTSGNEATYGITAGAMNGYSTTIIWDALQVQSLSFTYLGSGEYKYWVQMVYAYDGQTISGGTVKIAYPDGSLMSGNNTDGNGWVSLVLDGTSSGNATQSGTYDIFGDNDNNYGITYKYQNQTFSLNLLIYQKTGVNLSNALSHTVTIKDGSITVYSSSISGASSFTLRMPSTAETGFTVETPATIGTSAPDKCYVFMQWDDSSTNTVRSFTFTLLDKIVKAEYWYQLSPPVGPSLILTNTTEISASYDTTTKTLSIVDTAPTGLYVASVNCTGFGKPETISEQGIQFTERSNFADLVNCSYYFDATAEKLWIKYFSHSPETITIRWPNTPPPSVSPVVRVRPPPVIEWAAIVLGQVTNLGKIGEGETIRFLEGEYGVLSLSVLVKEPSCLATNAYAILITPNGTRRVNKMVLNSTSGIYQIFTTTFPTANLPEGNYSLTITIENSVGRTDTYGPIFIKVIRLPPTFVFLVRTDILYVLGVGSFIIGLGLAVWYTFYWRRRALMPTPPPTPWPPFTPPTVTPPELVRLPPTIELPPEIWKAEPRVVKLRKASLPASKEGLIKLEKIRLVPPEKEGLRIAKLRKAALKTRRKSKKPEE